MIKKIEYENKEGLQNDATIPDKNKVTDDDMNEIKEIVNTNADELGNKVDKEDGKGLSTNDYTNEDKEKLAGLNNYDDTEVKENITEIQTNVTEIQGNITNIETGQEEQNSRITELEEEKIELEKDIDGLSIIGQASGESIDLYDSSSARVKSFEVTGNSYQSTRSGKNKLLLNFTSNSSNYVNLEDDVFIFNKNVLSYDSNSFFYYVENLVIPAGTYTLSVNVLSGTSKNETTSGSCIYFRAVKPDGSYAINSVMISCNANGVTSTKGKITTTFEEDTEINEIRFYLRSTTKYENLRINVQLEPGEKATEYEKYGVMPSLDYPSEIKSSGDDINILPTNVVDWEQGTISSGLNNDNTKRIRTKDYIEVKPIVDYYISVKNKDYCFVNIAMYKEDETYINAYLNVVDSAINGAQGLKLNFPEDCEKIRIIIKKVDETDITAVEITDIKAKLELGDTETSYSLYGQGSINEVICGKNIFDSSIFSETTLNGVTIKRNDNGTITLNGTYQGSSSSQYRINMNHFPKKIAGKMSMKVISGTVSGGEVRFMLWDDNWNNKWVSPENTTYSTLSESTVYTKASITIYLGAICNNLVIGLQIEKGTTATEYEEYKEQLISIPVQQAMRAIGTIKDCFIVKEDGKRYERHNIARIESYNGEVINTEYMSTTGELSTGATVDYVLETPNDLECTSEQNTELDKLENLRSYKNITHIYSTDEVGAYVKVEYRKDLETYIMNNIQSSLETQTQNTISTIEEEGQE